MATLILKNTLHFSDLSKVLLYNRDLWRISQCLLLSVAKTIATTHVSTKVDYCNSITVNILLLRYHKITTCSDMPTKGSDYVSTFYAFYAA